MLFSNVPFFLHASRVRYGVSGTPEKQPPPQLACRGVEVGAEVLGVIVEPIDEVGGQFWSVGLFRTDQTKKPSDGFV